MYQILILLALMALGYFFGRHAENRHYRSIRKREKQLQELPTVATRIPPQDQNYEQRLVSGGVVISVDYFKRFLAGLRNFFGGRVKSYESLLDRARREAILRMKEQAYRQGASYVFNMKIETSSISKGAKDTVGAVEVFAYGTALIPPRTPE